MTLREEAKELQSRYSKSEIPLTIDNIPTGIKRKTDRSYKELEARKDRLSQLEKIYMDMAMKKELQTQEESVICRFYKIILSWDYVALKESKEQKKGTAESSLMKVKNRYTDVDDYIATYEPLIFEEAKSQITKEKEEEEVTDWKLGVVKSWSEADDFHFIEFPCEINEGESISQNDLLLLSRDKFADGKILPTFYAFALVEHVWKYFDTPLVRVRLYLAGEFLKYNTDDVKSCPRLFNMRSYICETERQLYFRKQCSLSTIAREYLAIRT